MNPIGGDSGSEVVVDVAELESAAAPLRSTRDARCDESVLVRAKGTREQLPLMRPPEAAPPEDAGRAPPDDAGRAPPDDAGRAPREMARDLPGCASSCALERDPAEVLRMWPHSMGARLDPEAAPRPRLRAPSAGWQLHDKIALAHLALDLYRELEDLQAVRSAGAAARGAPSPCGDRACQARIDALRGALVEACLLVQRVVLITPPELSKGEVGDRIRELLAVVGLDAGSAR